LDHAPAVSTAPDCYPRPTNGSIRV
jgi:hypothetical protein